MIVFDPHFSASVNVHGDALPRGTYFWQAHPWVAHPRHPWLEKPLEH